MNKPASRRKQQEPLPLDKTSFALRFLILVIASCMAFLIRLFAVIRFESVIHEYDPYFNYRTTQYFVEKGYYNFHNWFDAKAWYPLGRIIGGTIYPGLMITSSIIFHTLRFLHITIHIREVCVFLAPAFSVLTVLATYKLTKELANPGAGLFAAAFISIVPGYISRSVAGSYDNEGIAIFAMIFTYYLWIRATKTGSIVDAVKCAFAYFYMVSSWGGYVYLINLIPLHILTLMICDEFRHRHYIAYSTVYALGTIFSMQIPFVGFQPVQTSEHMAGLGVFGLCQFVTFSQYLRSRLKPIVYKYLLRSLISLFICGIGGFLCVVVFFGKVAPWTGRFYSLLDPSYAKNNIPIIASVSEHQPTAWSSYFFDMHLLVFLFPLGLHYCFKHVNDSRIFIILYGITALYFSGVMVRLMLVLAPVMCVIGGIAANEIVSKYMKHANFGDSDKKKKKTREDFPYRHEFAFAFLAVAFFLLMAYTLHCSWAASEAYSSPSIVLGSHRGGVLDDFREAYSWLRENTAKDARIMSWWDYGYQIAAMANRTVIVDNNTWNNTHISRVGQAMASNESHAIEIIRELDVDYVLVIFGGLAGYTGDDINKFLWMVRIGASIPEGRHIKEADYYTSHGSYSTGKEVSKTMSSSLMYKLCYYRFSEMQIHHSLPTGYDRSRREEIGVKRFGLEYFEEAFTSEHWIVRIYRVLPVTYD